MIIFSILFIGTACKENAENVVSQNVQQEEITYTSIGNEISADNAKSTSSMSETFRSMAVGDTINTKMIGKVDEVCQNKGCWMKINLEDGDQVMVKFKDYGFFMPKDIAGRDVVLNGKAFINEVPVDEQRHYAEDAGKSAEEIAAITEPKVTYSFEADGVLLKSE